PDTEPSAVRARPGLLASQVRVVGDLHGFVQRGGIVAAIVVAAGRRAVRHLLRRYQISPADLDGVETELVGQAVHHPLGFEVEMAARIAAVGPGEALVRHHHGRVDLEVLEGVWADEIARWTERASGLGAADVAADVVEPLE